MKNSYSDHRLQYMFHKFINTQSDWRNELNGIYLCGSKVIHQQGVSPAVFVLANEENSLYFGNAYCHSAWSCPHCTPRVMAKKARNVACAIDALHTWYKQDACMITFTMPHTKNMSAKDTFQILLSAWRHFCKNGKGRVQNYTLRTDKENDKRGVGKKGETRQYIKGVNAWCKARELGMTYSVKVYEFTWGEENGFHPHIHGLFWLPKKNFQKIGELESSLYDFWWECLKRATFKYYKNKHPEKSAKENQEITDNLFTDWRKKGNSALLISRNEDNSVRVITSSMYLDDWGGDAELTKYYGKEAHEGHYTPFQLITHAYESEGEERLKFLRIYTEYALATRKHRRMEFGKPHNKDIPTLNDIIKKWKETQTYVERCKKKAMEKATDFRVVCWFTEKQWSQICFLTHRYDVDLRSLILELARLPDGKRKIQELLFENAIDISQNSPHRLENLVEGIFNVA